MSEERLFSHKIVLESEAKGRVEVKLFPALQWQRKLRFGTFKKCHPRPKQQKIWWSIRYRLLLNGKWYGPRRYTLYTKSEVNKIILDNTGM